MQPVGVGLGAVSPPWLPGPTTCPRTIEGSPRGQKSLAVGWWGVFAVLVASIFFLGAIVGGFK